MCQDCKKQMLPTKTSVLVPHGSEKYYPPCFRLRFTPRLLQLHVCQAATSPCRGQNKPYGLKRQNRCRSLLTLSFLLY